ncbi:DnaJ C-terminal domain-containing protein [Sediminicoccus rosea]|jgi:DnaJ-class molecular chaperone|uniref:DnaJ C-terminal domain-containing protein n=1 Tax=Sediminicoccus rosea TaxID=1225128 RepID=A0ABZ0PNC4_9PROT|nr:DnaJ C-terminal domain-containing protein [Sediminicoccus rosea]WPB87050.1 DnaJ C-terminal domain-containing protein [Sediminicoccus rosea]
MAEDPYKTLGVPRDASPEAIKAAYRKLARQHHPDLNPGKPEAEARFKAVSAANDLLSDPEKRARFDRGEIDAEGQEQRPAGGYRQYAEQPTGEKYGARYGQRPEAEVFEDLFADLFEQRRRAESAPRRGQDESYRLAVPFLHAVQGATETLTLPDGRSLSVKIPPGVETGQVLRLRGQGGPGRNGGPAGDALIELEVAEDKLYRRDGFDLHMELPVTLKEAVLGGPVLVPTPGGPLRVTLPEGSDSGRQIRLRGRGVAAHGGREAGDLFLTPRIVIGAADEALKAFLRDWTPEQPEDPRAGLGETP